ncbi:MAG: pyridoxamine 5'-phosphate oxidase family protein [Rectinemataceae bacterium]
MSTLAQEMKDMVGSQQCFIATVSKDAAPNVAPKRSTRVFDDGSLIFTEGTGGATYRNILDGSKVAVAVVNREIPDGGQEDRLRSLLDAVPRFGTPRHQSNSLFPEAAER